MTTREKDVERAFVRRVEKAGGRAYKLTSPGRRNVPDRIVVMPGGTPWFAEIKAPGEKLRPGQMAEVEKLRAMGQRIKVIDSIDAANEVPL